MIPVKVTIYKGRKVDFSKTLDMANPKDAADYMVRIMDQSVTKLVVERVKTKLKLIKLSALPFGVNK